MELWVRSQDKDSLIKVEKITLIYDCLCCDDIQLIHIETDKGRIGSYKTKERALEVLEEIQNILKPQMILSKVGKPIAETCDGLVYKEPDEYEIKELSTYVYQMPEE